VNPTTAGQVSSKMNDKKVLLPTFERSQMVGNLLVKNVNQPQEYNTRKLADLQDPNSLYKGNYQ